MTTIRLKRSYPIDQEHFLSHEREIQASIPSILPEPQGLSLFPNICYGALSDGAARCLDASLAPGDTYLTECQGFYKFSVKNNGRNFTLQRGEGEDFAVLDTKTIGRLATLDDLPLIWFEALGAANEFSKRRKQRKQRTTHFLVSINIFGPPDASCEVSTRLTKVSAFLQHPKWLEPGVQYSNPQYFRLPGEDPDMTGFVGFGSTPARERNAKISEEVEAILDSLATVTEGDFNLPEGLRSQLKPYQEDGVRFILQRETEQVIQHLQNDLQRVARLDNEQLPPSYGGIVADAMGLGKTLTILTAILHSLASANDWMFQQSGMSYSTEKTRTRATLVVVTSAQLLESWKSQIAEHFTPGSLTPMIFHGSKRTSNIHDLMSPSIVLTTYATVAADFDGLGVLDQMSWYRIVLDEAHQIRNSGSKQFNALSKLVTDRRWCITGTPIPNKLDDLTSLVAFLRLPPFPTKSSFQNNILEPLCRGGPDYSKPLRAYLQAYCLRRAENHLKLLEPYKEVVLLNFSSEEYSLYQRILDQSQREIDNIISSANNIKKYNILFTAILRMRMLCNRGTFPSEQTSADLDLQSDTINCDSCLGTREDDAMIIASRPPCSDCSQLHVSGFYSDIPMNEETTQCEMYPTNPHSTKLSAVVRNVVNHSLEAKHIIFSYWTSTLDALRTLLDMERITYLQVDGRTQPAERSNRLDAFRQDTSIVSKILANPPRLNLTAANIVHIVEPQWNPSTEDQAVARALRTGQTKQVKVFRYIMKSTIEENQNIVGIQQKKKRLATFTLGDTGGDNMKENLELPILRKFDPSHAFRVASTTTSCSMDYLDGPPISQILILACTILVIFASTLILIPKSAVLSRIGLAVALSCLQYSFYTSLLESSLSQVQITGISLFSWGLYTNGAEQILLSRYDADDVLTAKEKHSGRCLGPVTLLLRAMGMYFSLRRVGLRGEIPMEQRVSSNSLRFVITKSIECVVSYLILDAVLLAPHPEGHLITREKQALFKLFTLTWEDVIFRISSSIGNWVIAYFSVRLGHGSIAVGSVLLGLSKPEDWPHLNGPISSWSTVRTFWGTFWHRLFRKALTGWGDFIPDRVLRVHRGTLLSRYLRLTLAFFTSALMHRCLHYFYRLDAGDWYEIETFFLLQPLAIMFEDAIQAATVHIPLSRPLRQTVGFMWLWVFFTWSTPTFLYPTLRAKDPGQMLPFSAVGRLMKR
ncbi:hypothetical protein F53441_2685 [Fusarium austroafricanum]|uniref:Helicase ATP-binding domain-containing protein n=1 Tax=Fusarium austroafricanum TaxID=2364996 RepID=A0A8H4PBM9_9HYPO|nr:hypothetical protein F53441_2685 [Fusarium austroafricanum]